MWRVLCIDDDADLLGLLESSATRVPDLEVVAVERDTQHLRDLLLRHEPDLVVLDHDISTRRWGLDAVEIVRSARPDAVVALFTGRPGLRRAALNAGCHLHVEKPHIDELWTQARRLLAARAVVDLREEGAQSPSASTAAAANWEL